MLKYSNMYISTLYHTIEVWVRNARRRARKLLASVGKVYLAPVK
jgi:hypothetical protein